LQTNISERLIIKILILNGKYVTAKGTYDKAAFSAVALDTRKTNAGLNLFPPAPKICSAADTKTGFSAPTSCRIISVIARCVQSSMAVWAKSAKPPSHSTDTVGLEAAAAAAAAYFT
jgi:hypothetical protein